MANFIRAFKLKINFSDYSLLYFLSHPILLGRLIRSFLNKDCFRCGLFLGSFVAIFKVCIF